MIRCVFQWVAVALVGLCVTATDVLDSCTGTVPYDASINQSEYIQIAGTLNCGSICQPKKATANPKVKGKGKGRGRGKGQEKGALVDPEAIDFYVAYRAWTNHTNTLGGIAVGGPAKRRYKVNITVCDDGGNIASSRRSGPPWGG